jgi:serine/threonine protein kinase
LVAIKVIDKAKLEAFEQLEDMKREIAIMKMLNHENVVSLKDMYATHTKLYMVVDLQQGGDLYTKVRREGPLGETVARFLFQELVLGLDHCHAMGIAHGSLSLECLLLNQDGHIKISDFGSATLDFDTEAGDEGGGEEDTSMYLEQFYFPSPHSHTSVPGDTTPQRGRGSVASSTPAPGSPQRTPASQASQAASPVSVSSTSARGKRVSYRNNGSLFYMCPEVVRDCCFDGKKADVWSTGVILYAMLAGRLPFGFISGRVEGCDLRECSERRLRDRPEDEVAGLTDNICRGVFQPLAREYYSQESALLLRLLLEPDCAHRPQLGRVVRHAWCRWGDASAVTKASSVFEPAYSAATPGTEEDDTCNNTLLPSFLCNPFGVFGTKEAPLPPVGDGRASSPWPSSSWGGISKSVDASEAELESVAATDFSVISTLRSQEG